MRALLTVCFLLVGSLGTGCSASRLQLKPPPAVDAPLAERLAYFEDNRARYGESETDVFGLYSEVRLGNGAVAEEAADLLPVLDAHSPAAEAIVEYQRTDHLGDVWTWVAVGTRIVGWTAGAALTGAGTWMQQSVKSDAAAATAYGPWVTASQVGGIAIGVVASLPALPALYYTVQSRRSKSTAFERYNASLAKRLGLADDATENEDEAVSAPFAGASATGPRDPAGVE